MIKKKINTEKLFGEIENIGILTCITLLIFLFLGYNASLTENTRVFYLQYHNVDLTFNLQNIVSAINGANLYTENGTIFYIPFENITDVGSDYQERKISDYYIPSMNNIDTAFLKSTKDLNKYLTLGILDVLILGLLLGRKL